MTSLATLRRRRDLARLALAKAEACPKKRGRGEARRAFIRATAALLRAQAARRETGDLFSQIGA